MPCQSYIPLVIQRRHLKRCDNEIKLTDAASDLKYATAKPALGQVLTVFRKRLKSPASKWIPTLLLQGAVEQQDIFGNRLNPVPIH